MSSPRRLACLLTLALARGGCPSLSERAGPPPSVERAAQLEQQGDLPGAAHVYETLAEQNSGTDRNELLLSAARDYLDAHRTDDGARVLALIDGTLTPEQSSLRALLNVQLTLARGQREEAARQLSAIPQPAGGAAAARYRELKASLAAGVAAAGAHAATPAAPHPGAPGEAGAHLALLLPVSGRAAGAAVSVRDGFMTAYYQVPAAERPRVRVYDTGTMSIAEALTQARTQGADFIVGPLTREEVTAAAQYPGARAAVLALNYLPPEQPAPAQFYQFALSP